jgi:hypothetical protein
MFIFRELREGEEYAGVWSNCFKFLYSSLVVKTFKVLEKMVGI